MDGSMTKTSSPLRDLVHGIDGALDNCFKAVERLNNTLAPVTSKSEYAEDSTPPRGMNGSSEMVVMLTNSLDRIHQLETLISRIQNSVEI